MPGTAVHVMGDDSEAAWGECFICTQEAPISSLVHGVCACRERYVHVACQRQMLEQSAFSESCQVPTCPVCHSEYTNSRMGFKQAPLMSPDQLLQTRLRAHLPSPSHRCPVQTGAAHAPRPIAPDSPSRPHTLALSSVPRAFLPHQGLSAEGKLCVVLVLCNLLLVLCASVELRAWAFGHGHCGVCLQVST